MVCSETRPAPHAQRQGMTSKRMARGSTAKPSPLPPHTPQSNKDSLHCVAVNPCGPLVGQEVGLACIRVVSALRGRHNKCFKTSRPPYNWLLWLPESWGMACMPTGGSAGLPRLYWSAVGAQQAHLAVGEPRSPKGPVTKFKGARGLAEDRGEDGAPGGWCWGVRLGSALSQPCCSLV